MNIGPDVRAGEKEGAELSVGINRSSEDPRPEQDFRQR